MSVIYSFCETCECYHVNWRKSNLDLNYETHLSEAERIEKKSFPIYFKDIETFKNMVSMVCCDRENVELAVKKFPTGFWERKR